MTLVSTVTVGAGGAQSITWSSIPQSGSDLMIVCSFASAQASADVTLAFNGSETSFSRRTLRGNGSTATSANAANNYISDSSNTTSYTANTFSNVSIYIPNYAGSTNKTLSIESVTENNATAGVQTLHAMQWSNTAAITSLTLTNGATADNFKFAQYSTASLYTIQKGSGGASVS